MQPERVTAVSRTHWRSASSNSAIPARLAYVGSDGYRQVILFANRRFGEMVELPSSAIVGKPISTLLGASSRAAVTEPLAVPPGATAEAEVHLVGHDGSRPVSLSASCLDVDGLLVRCLIATDGPASR